MKIELNNVSLFPGDEKEVRDYFRSFIYSLAEQYKVPSAVFNNLLGLFELFLYTNREGQDLDAIQDAVSKVLEWLENLNSDVLKHTYEISSEYMREANDSFWSMSNSNPTTSSDYSFAENVDKIFDSINRVLEFMIKREGYLISLYESRFNVVPKKVDLFTVIESSLAFLNRFTGLAVNSDNLKGIPLNQWRNISAHRDYSCNGEVVCVSYGRNIIKEECISWRDLEVAFLEIYRLRANVKFVVSIVLIVLTVRNDELADLVKYSPKSLLNDINLFFTDEGFCITRFEKSEGLVIDGKQQKTPEGFVVFDVEFMHKESTDEQLCLTIRAVSEALSSVFGEHNSLPQKEKVLLHYRSVSPCSGFHMVYTFD